jgi:hypothetical protein
MDATVGVAEEFMRAAETLALSAESTDGLMDLVNMLSVGYQLYWGYMKCKYRNLSSTCLSTTERLLVIHGEG